MDRTLQILAMGFFDGDVLGPVILGIGFLAIPIVSILTRHQRKMAEIIHGSRREDVVLQELDAVRSEVAELRSQLRSLSAPTSKSLEEESLTRRLG